MLMRITKNLKQRMAETVIALRAPMEISGPSYSAAVARRRQCEAEVAKATEARNDIRHRFGGSQEKKSREEIKIADDTLEKAEACLLDARRGAAAVKESRESQFDAQVRRRLADAVDTMSEVADLLVDLTTALDVLHTTAWKNGWVGPPVLREVPELQRAALALQRIINLSSPAAAD